MTCTVCTNCGCDLEPFAPLQIGHLAIDDPLTVRWRGQVVRLTAHQRLIVIALARADGKIMRRIALAEAAGSDERKDPHNLVDVQLHRIKAAFRDVDPAFDAIRSVWGQGIRWRTGE